MSLTHHGAATAPAGQSCTGPLAAHVEAFAAQLLHKGYAQNTVRAKCDLLADLSRWLERRGLPVAALDEARLTQFLATRRRRIKTRRGDRASGQQLLEHLRELGEIAATVQRIDRTAVACLTREFEVFLHAERGLAPSTVSAQRVAMSAATVQTVSPEAFVLIARPGIRRAPTAHRVDLLSADQVVALVRRREAILSDRTSARYAAEASHCQRCAFRSQCDGAGKSRRNLADG